MQWQQKYVDGVRTRWLEHGSGRPVVLVHGIPTSPRLWRRVMPLVRGRSLAWEMRGYGSSIRAGRDSDLGLAAQAGYLLAWLDSLELDEPPVPVGHDLGGGVAQIAAVRAPGRFSALALTNSVCYDSWPIPSVRLMRRLAPVLARSPEVVMYAMMAQLLHRGHDNRRRALESIGVHWAPYVAQGAASSLIRQIRALDARDTLAVAGRLPALALPARVVWGEADGFQKVHYGERLATDLHTVVQRIPGGKHFTPEDHPETVAAAVNDLLAT